MLRYLRQDNRTASVSESGHIVIGHTGSDSNTTGVKAKTIADPDDFSPVRSNGIMRSYQQSDGPVSDGDAFRPARQPADSVGSKAL